VDENFSNDKGFEVNLGDLLNIRVDIGDDWAEGGSEAEVFRSSEVSLRSFQEFFKDLKDFGGLEDETLLSRFSI